MGGEAAAPAGDRLSQRDFDRLARFIHQYSGIKMPAGKVTMLEGRLRRRVRATGSANLAAYCRWLFDQDGLDQESVHLIDAVTTNKTEFFREPDHFQFLAEQAVPALIKARHGRAEALKIWSAASSIGAEPYTLAMVMAELEERIPGLKSAIMATDICTEVLAEARLGIYPEAMTAAVPPALRTRWVRRGRAAARGLSRIAPELRARVRFGRLNLMDHAYPLPTDIDVIFCRNILIYFDKPTQLAVLRRLCDHLRPGGFLFLGHSETLAGFDLPVSLVGSTTFRRH